MRRQAPNTRGPCRFTRAAKAASSRPVTKRSSSVVSLRESIIRPHAHSATSSFTRPNGYCRQWDGVNARFAKISGVLEAVAPVFLQRRERLVEGQGVQPGLVIAVSQAEPEQLGQGVGDLEIDLNARLLLEVL